MCTSIDSGGMAAAVAIASRVPSQQLPQFVATDLGVLGNTQITFLTSEVKRLPLAPMSWLAP